MPSQQATSFTIRKERLTAQHDAGVEKFADTHLSTSGMEKPPKTDPPRKSVAFRETDPNSRAPVSHERNPNR
jgi:hypothetical protein